MQHVGVHEVNVLAVLPRDHRVQAVDLAREERQALVPHLGAVERVDAEPQEVVGLQQLRQHDFAVERRVRGVVAGVAVVVVKLHEARVLDAVHLRGRVGEDGPFGQRSGRARRLIS